MCICIIQVENNEKNLDFNSFVKLKLFILPLISAMKNYRGS